MITVLAILPCPLRYAIHQCQYSASQSVFRVSLDVAIFRSKVLQLGSMIPAALVSYCSEIQFLSSIGGTSPPPIPPGALKCTIILA